MLNLAEDLTLVQRDTEKWVKHLSLLISLQQEYLQTIANFREKGIEIAREKDPEQGMNHLRNLAKETEKIIRKITDLFQSGLDKNSTIYRQLEQHVENFQHIVEFVKSVKKDYLMAETPIPISQVYEQQIDHVLNAIEADLTGFGEYLEGLSRGISLIQQDEKNIEIQMKVGAAPSPEEDEDAEEQDYQ